MQTSANVCAHTTDVLEDYAARGAALADECFLDFCLTSEDSGSRHVWDIRCIPYQLGRGRDDRSRVRLLKEILPCFKGRWIPRLDDDASADLHRAIVLLLLKPWRYLPDVLGKHRDWEIELGEFLFYADRKTMWRAYNLQFFHEAEDATIDFDVTTV